MEYKKQYAKYQEICEEGIKTALQNFPAPEPLMSAMKYSIEAGGKRLRPVLMLAMADILGGSVENVLPFAVAIELIHTYSLIHDDLPCMDNDDFRRGIYTNHKVFGEGMALLAGDSLLNMAYELIFRHILQNNTEYNINAGYEIASSSGCLGMAGGQSLDLYSVNNPLAGEKELLYIHKHKTGKLICASLVAGAYASKTSEQNVEIIRQAGEELGILFQITDDILDVVGDFEKMGKNTGKDQALNKLTYPGLYGLELSRIKAKQSADKIINLLDTLKSDSEFFKEITLNMLNRNK